MRVHDGKSEVLLEREHELAVLDDVLDGAAAGTGALSTVVGEPGIGKSALLARARSLAGARSMIVLGARAGELESELTFGVVRQLLEGPAHEERAILEGAARHAVGLLGVDDGGATDEPSLLHALYWVCANLAARAPVCITVDDAHWADTASLRWLVYLGRRLDSLAVAVVVGITTGEPDAPRQLLDALTSQAGERRLRPAPLSRESTLTLVRRTAAAEIGEDACAAVHEAAGGNPFLIQEATVSLTSGGHELTALRPEAVAGTVLRRLDRLPSAATALARAVAVLGPDASLAAAATLAGLDAETAAATADQLAQARLLGAERPLVFAHPLWRSTVYESMGAGERSRAHARAARVLHGAGAMAPRVVGHLLFAEPAGDPEVVRLLCAAGAAEPDPGRAITAFARALEEASTEAERAAVLLQLGEAEMRAYRLEAIGHLTDARALATDRDQWLTATRALARAWTLDPRPDEALAWVRQELAGEPLTADHSEVRDVRIALHALEVIRGSVDPDQARALRAAAASAATAAERYLLAALGYKAVGYGTAADAAGLAELALAGGLQSEGVRGTGAMLVIAALEGADALDRADAVSQTFLAHARANGDVSGSALALTVHADVACRRGALADAEAEAREALVLADEHGLPWAEPVAIATLIEALGEQGRGQEADAILAEHALSDWQQSTARAATLLYGRGRLRLAQGRAADALEDFRRSGEVMQRYGVDHPAWMGWRSGAAEALLQLGRPDEASALADEELALARPFGAVHAIGAALRVAGLARHGEDGIGLLHEAVAMLDRSADTLLRARALVDLGAALRRAGQRSAGREELSRGLDAAQRCGATALAERASAELEASGARPRRRPVSGIDALTPSERRVAAMAATGLSNRDVAQSLFLSVRTVENQLRQVYLKLGISSRRELARALEPD